MLTLISRVESVENMATSAYFMGSVQDPRNDCRMVPNRDATNVDLANIGVEMSSVDMTSKWEEHLDNLIAAYDMNHRDEIQINRTSMPDFDKKLKMFFEEHLHQDPELRFIKSGTGFFDVRSIEARIFLVKSGDFLFLPAGIYHRFTTDRNENVVAIRLFRSSPKWKSYARCKDSDAMEERSNYLKTIGVENRP
ncbi:hypothetical protein KIN20_002633 [Parelaphostrongylus tenuis]|uniref:acireductone dioxygenase (Fe(2+)-requiring) n=1 Tax=Parelaphostrongylus tenuis TaxID=148309 RepID=A0AAD5LW30_PARTN|nr:hypothetical protein KIN20_002633 [Parelaphostrongylus tenuis]